jgi:2-polyprenyl-3-methyl-5-hydroxy-6-metoxy-1,4-benzoquinol methylase
MSDIQLLPATSNQNWPAGETEQVADCPICGGTERRLLHSDLSDRLFFVAPGTWSLWQCVRCHTARLDPRPTAASIHLAYRNYYTHSEPDTAGSQTRFQRLRAALGNGYRNRRYGTSLHPSSPIGAVIASVVPPLRWPVDAYYRFLPRADGNSTRRVLDIGCSNGAWLELARDVGWRVAGVEPDPISRKLAHDRGIEVRQSTNEWRSEPSTFDYITMNHVIEHLHDPSRVLLDSYALLRPGGGIYIDTPNIDAWGHEIYGRDWLHLDPPRHLMLFSRQSLNDLVSRSGFERIQFHGRSDPFGQASLLSRRIRAGLAPISDDTSPAMGPPPGMITRLRASLARRRAEFLTLTAVKPQ